MDTTLTSQVTLKVYLNSAPQKAPLIGEITCRPGLGLQALAARHPKLLPVDFDCRKADCGVCLIRVRGEVPFLSPPTTEERDFLRAMGCSTDGKERLACQARVLAAAKLT